MTKEKTLVEAKSEMNAARDEYTLAALDRDECPYFVNYLLRRMEELEDIYYNMAEKNPA